jgi:hypothetical protein
MRPSLVSCSVSFVTLVLFACGGNGSSSNGVVASDASTDSPPATSDGPSGTDSPTSDDGSTLSDAPLSDASPPSDAPSEGGSLAYYGIVAAAIVPTVGNTYSVSTSYGAAPGYVVPGSTCAGTTSGDCCYVPAAQPTDAGADAGSPPAPPSAGIVTIAAAADAGTLTTMTPTGGAYTPVTNPPTTSVTWNPGDSLSIAATGDQVHPYSGTLATGALFSGVTPTLDDAMTINRGQDFQITWTSEGLQGETVTLVVSASSVAGSHGVITCVVPDSQAQVTVSSSLFGHFSTGDHASVQLLRTVLSKAAADNATIYLEGQVSSTGAGTFF